MRMAVVGDGAALAFAVAGGLWAEVGNVGEDRPGVGFLEGWEFFESRRLYPAGKDNTGSDLS